MSIFYTKDQIDSLATVIGERIKSATNEAALIESLQKSGTYSILTSTEKENALKNNSVENALNIDSYISSLESGFNLPE